MPIDITMPRLSDTMESGTVLKWNVAEGSALAAGDVVADVETDKATMELSVYDDGTLAKILVGEGATVEVGTVIAVMAEDGEDLAEVAAGAGTAPARNGQDAETPAETPADASPAAPDAPEPGAAPDGGRVRISPVARRLADEHGVDLGRIRGSGPAGRIIKRDVLGAIDATAETAASKAPSAAAITPAAPAPRVAATPVPSQSTSTQSTSTQSTSTQSLPAQSLPTRAAPVDEPGAETLPMALSAGRVPLSGKRQTIARRLVESTTTIPHYQVSMAFDMDPLLDLRRTLNEQLAPMGVKLSVNDFLVRACALAMHQHADFNASWDGDAIVVHPDVNIGIAIAVGAAQGGGLVVGVIQNADRQSLRAISQESKRLAEKARTRGLSLEEMSGSTFTLSNLGMFGVEHFTAIINPPNSAILAVGGAIEKPVVRKGELTVGHEMTVTLSNDHRIIDGAMAAQYLQTVKRLIESPGTVLV